MKRFVILILFFLSFFEGVAQSISVKSFRALPMDMTASSLEGKRIDQNGEVAALIKVMTTEKGFVFEGGTLGIVNTQQRVGEIWVWVPRGLRKITILHQQLGGLRDYRFPLEIEAERTYEMVLSTSRVESFEKEEVRQQYLAFHISPANATLEVDNVLWSVDADGNAMKYVDFGTYSYRVRASDYFTEAGNVTVANPDSTEIVNVTLQPNFAEVTLAVDADAEIWVNNEKKGIRTWTGPLGNGTYKIECKQEGCETKTISQVITADMKGQTITLPVPIPANGSINVESSPMMATVFIDGTNMGSTPRFIKQIPIGEHTVKLVKEGFVDYEETVVITRNNRSQITATLEKISKQASDNVAEKKLDQPKQTNENKEFSNEDMIVTIRGISFVMKPVEGGSFLMGAPALNNDEAKNEEKPEHSVTLNSYYIGETEVTQALWNVVMDVNPSVFTGYNLPVDNVSWNDCQKFIKRLNRLTGKNFRLPTEAEWEYAARGGKKRQGFKFAGGNTLEDVAWCYDNSGNTTHEVKSKNPNKLGIYDMSGNVYEWCSDWYNSYEIESQTNPQGPTSGFGRVLRGGSWNGREQNCRVSSRYFTEPTNSYNYLGFRLVLQ